MKHVECDGYVSWRILETIIYKHGAHLTTLKVGKQMDSLGAPPILDHAGALGGLLDLCSNLRSINLIVRCTLGSQQEVNSCRCLAKLNNLSKATLILDYTTPELHSPSEWMPLGNSVARVLLCNTACDETLVSQFSLQYTNLRSSQLSTNVD